MNIKNPLARVKALFRQSNSAQPISYNTFEGVFKPTLLTILGAIMYLRLGWVVGNAGLLGGMLVIFAALSITLATGLSLSSIASNTRLEAGGPYAMIAKALGLEVGGAIGIPLFLSQACAVAMYIFGFREGWLRIFSSTFCAACRFNCFLDSVERRIYKCRISFSHSIFGDGIDYYFPDFYFC